VHQFGMKGKRTKLHKNRSLLGDEISKLTECCAYR
jgi:hypothetical protein